MGTMQLIARTPILKLCVALAVNMGLIILCHRYWTASTSHTQQQVHDQQQGIFKTQIEILEHQYNIKLQELEEQIERAQKPSPLLEPKLLSSFKVSG